MLRIFQNVRLRIKNQNFRLILFPANKCDFVVFFLFQFLEILWQNFALKTLQHSATLLLSLVVSREDARKKYLKKLVDACVLTIENCEGKWSINSELVGSLRLLAAIFKKVKYNYSSFFIN